MVRSSDEFRWKENPIGRARWHVTILHVNKIPRLRLHHARQEDLSNAFFAVNRSMTHLEKWRESADLGDVTSTLNDLEESTRSYGRTQEVVMDPWRNWINHKIENMILRFIPSSILALDVLLMRFSGSIIQSRGWQFSQKPALTWIKFILVLKANHKPGQLHSLVVHLNYHRKRTKRSKSIGKQQQKWRQNVLLMWPQVSQRVNNHARVELEIIWMEPGKPRPFIGTKKQRTVRAFPWTRTD